MASKYITQNQKILKYLRKHPKGITPLDALNLCGCLRLSARIYNLRDQGYNIYTSWEEKITDEGTRKRYARYILHSKEKV